ncbi:MAG: nitroreductase family protein [Lachnospiraceae bacterium]|nr:nitroreductase family protein [Lachnospiraceae bacterium]
MTAQECIKGRRSIRQFTPDKIDHKLLSEIVEAASFSPSWKNTQIVRYIAVEGDMKNKIAAEATAPWPGNGKIIESAPVLIAVTVIKNRCGYERDGSFTTPRKDTWQMFDAGIASQTFCLAAYEKGIGSVILGIFDQEKIESLLQIPEDRELVALIPIGYPNESPAVPKRKTVDDLLSFIS